MSKFDYTWRCDCDAEGSTITLAEARKESRLHLKNHTDKTPNWKIFIDQYNKEEGELSGKYWEVIKNK